MALLGGAIAAGSHFTKAGTRVAANASPEPFSNWALSFFEDLFVIGLGMLALKYPVAAFVVTVADPGGIVLAIRWIVRKLAERVQEGGGHGMNEPAAFGRRVVAAALAGRIYCGGSSRPAGAAAARMTAAAISWRRQPRSRRCLRHR